MNLARFGVALSILIVLILLSIAYALNTSLMDARADREQRETQERSWRTTHDERIRANEDRLNELTAAIAELKRPLEKVLELHRSFADLDARVAALGSSQSDLRKGFGNLRAERSELARQNSGLQITVNDISKTLGDSQSHSDALKKSVAEILARIEGLHTELSSTRSNVEQSLEELGALRSKSAQLSVEIMRTREKFDSELATTICQNTSTRPVSDLDRDPGERTGATDKPTPTPIQAHVAAVSNADGIVVLDRGSDAGIKLGTRFGIFRDNEWLATIEIHRVSPGNSGGNILRKIDERDIEEGDRAKQTGSSERTSQ